LEAPVIDIATKLATVMRREVGEGEVSNLVRLSGGANMESSSFDFGGAGYVLRRAPSAAMMEGRPFGHDVEAALVRAARAAGVRAPEVVAEIMPDDDFGTGYVMRRVEAEVNPAGILANPPPSLLSNLARELARIHAIRPREDLAIKAMDTAAALADLKTRFLAYGGDRPIIALALRWCEDNLPETAAPCLVHGDFRMGNLMVDANGLAAVLDWELAHWGDAHEDLAYGCMAVWRFGHYDRPAFGVGSMEELFAAYEAAGGVPVDAARFRFWLVYRTLWWALGCLQMADIWRSGIDRNLERAVIGRRTSENEIDLLLLLEPDAPETERARIQLPPEPVPRQSGEPSQAELLTAVREWIDSDIKAKSEGRAKFMAAVAMNALSMAIRAEDRPVGAHDAALSAALLSGEATLATQGLLAKLRRIGLAKLANDSPKYASLHEARTAWLNRQADGVDDQSG
jgi:aminoglycoside phosphotransferase (APT) family kinase protein